jgi:hypothetical protein
MDVVQRVQAILLRPREEWAKIKGETATASGLFKSYAMILAAIPAAAQFLGRLLFRSEIPFARVPEWTAGRAFANAVISYLLSLAMVYLFAFIINTLAPSFSSVPHISNAMKLAVYSMTPFWVAGVLYVIPRLGVLVALAGLYGLYLLFLGIEAPLMETPKHQAMGFLGVNIIALAALFLLRALILGVFSLRPMI